MASLQLRSIHCTATEDFVGADETFIVVNGVRVWGADMNDGQTLPLAGVPPIFFVGNANVQVFDEDVPPIDPHDRLTSFDVSDTLAGLGPRLQSFRNGRADYTISYEVFF